MAQRDWVIEHMDRYKATGGEDGHMWKGVDGNQNLPCLILTTTGRRSGKQYDTALIYGKDGDNYVIVASMGGAPKHPRCYDNLAANPPVERQVIADHFTATTRTASGEERARLWTMMAEIFPTYDNYHEKAKDHREIPVVVCEPA
ncbi:MAG: nitroreductase family deazaflavin-dependent oxidoreductase [Rhodospirillaceae bacterium]|nr:nitroreductase family deazaflavin-dependent oxidoreductase [Rhodospirillaceae bacterium]